MKKIKVLLFVLPFKHFHYQWRTGVYHKFFFFREFIYFWMLSTCVDVPMLLFQQCMCCWLPVYIALNTFTAADAPAPLRTDDVVLLSSVKRRPVALWIGRARFFGLVLERGSWTLAFPTIYRFQGRPWIPSRRPLLASCPTRSRVALNSPVSLLLAVIVLGGVVLVSRVGFVCYVGVFVALVVKWILLS